MKKIEIVSYKIKKKLDFGLRFVYLIFNWDYILLYFIVIMKIIWILEETFLVFYFVCRNFI